MTPRKGPTKKLAPSINPDAGCKHDYSEYEGLQLEIDCTDCNGAQDLGNRNCLSAIMNVLASGAQPEAIVLKRFIHKRYRGEAVGRVSNAASILASLNRAIASTIPLSDKRCRTCLASTDQLLVVLRHSLMEDPLGFADSPSEFAEEVLAGLPGVDCGDAKHCLECAMKAAEAH